MSDAQLLLTWFETTARSLPWRHNRNLYSTIVSEFMLQQTRVSTVIPFFQKWMVHFPTIESVASAQETELLALWQGLGYYNRARRLQQVCIALSQAKPQATIEYWLSLPGIGDYTARAILSMYYGQPLLAWDGNLLRVFSRLQATHELDEAKITQDWMLPLETNSRKVLNEALMDLGATICSPKNPQCSLCPLSKQCCAYQQQRVTEFPVKKLVPNNKLEFHRGLYITDTHIALIQNDIKSSSLYNFWELPLISPTGSPIGIINRSIGKHSIREFVYKLLTPPERITLQNIEKLDILPMNGPHKKYIKLLKHA